MSKMHPIFEAAMAPFLRPVATRNGPACPECAQYDRVHDQTCPAHPDYDPSPVCAHCGPVCHCNAEHD